MESNNSVIMALIEMRKLLNRFREIIVHLDPSELPKKRDQVTPQHYLLSSFAVEHAPDPIYWILPDATIFWANQSACLSLGLTREELTGRSVLDIDPDFDQSAWDAHWNDIKANKKRILETKHKHKNGKVFPVEITANYLNFDGGEYNYAIARDITERKQNELDKEKSRQQLELLMVERTRSLERDLVTSDERLRLAIEASQAGIWDWN
jgi:PAS domain S-box-containing protein